MGCLSNDITTQDFTVGLVQINNSFSGQNYLPLTVGMLQSYAQENLTRPELYHFQLPIYRRIPVDEAVEQLEGVDIVLFSAYVWNFRISLEVASKLKAKCPETVIVFGGPQVPDRAEKFLLDNPHIDLACHGEGEQIIVNILENLGAKTWSDIPGISFIDASGAFVTNPKGARLDDLSAVPSPYLNGMFEQLMEANPQETWIVLWETNRGCPFSCTFCDWGSAVQSKLHPHDLQRLYSEVDWFALNHIEFVFCCDANFGILPRDIEIAKYVAEVKSKKGYPHALSVQNTKNATERAYETQKILADAGLNKGVDIALQSTDSITLESVKRANISIDTYEELQRRFTRDGIETYTDIILGLPGESYNSFADGVSRIIQNGQHNRIQFNNLSILPNAEMGDPEYQKKFGMKTVESNIINIHGSLADTDNEITETQQLVIATDSMQEEDWVKTRVFSWTAGLLHFDKVLQIPLILAHELCNISYRELFEVFCDGDFGDYPAIHEMNTLFIQQAQFMQSGGPEYTQSEEWLGIWWPSDEYVLISLCVAGKLGEFYADAERLLEKSLKAKGLSLPDGLLHDAIELNRNLMKLPFQTENIDVELSYNVREFWRASVDGTDLSLEMKPSAYHVNRTTETWSSWDDWCREVVWYGNKKGAYLYGSNIVESQLSGHF